MVSILPYLVPAHATIALDQVEFSNILVRATNWIGDAVMSLPALAALRKRFPQARISILAKPWVAGLYERETFADEVILYDPRKRREMVRDLRRRRFDCAILLQNALEAALIAFLARIPTRIGYNRDGRGFLLTHSIPLPRAGDIPRHERFYYLELLRRAGILEKLPESSLIRLTPPPPVQRGRVVGVSPGAAFGNAKRWLPERFADAALQIARRRNASIALFGSAAEAALCAQISARLGDHPHCNHAGQTTLSQFIELAAACEVFLTNDSGAMHIASALGVPTIAIFGATDDIGPGPTGSNARVVRQKVDCSPCLLRECPIDHRCMTQVTVERVAAEALALLGETNHG
jgi:heptosyltransferase-2